MAIDPKIASIKTSGSYRFEFDKSQVVGIPSNQIRLIVGFSRTGPFNTPVFCPDTGFFKQVFGDIDRTLERKDSYFHRSCLSALERGPILALNLLSLDSQDEVQYRKFSASSMTYNEDNNVAKDGEYAGFYNKDKFWYPEDESFLSLVGAPDTFSSSQSITNDLVDFTNLGQNPVSVIIRKAAAANVNGFNVTAEEWFGTANVPGYLNKDSLMSDFMVDVFFIDGNYGGDFGAVNPYERFNADPTYQKYFDKSRGIERKRTSADVGDTYLEQFFNEPEVNVISQYTVSLLPNFIDQLGNNLFIETLINADTASTGMFCAVNQDLFDGDKIIDGVMGGIDLIGHDIEKQGHDTVNFLSYEGPITSDLADCRKFISANQEVIATQAPVTIQLTSGDFEIAYSGTTGDPLYDALAAMTANTPTNVGSFILGSIGANYIPVTGVNVTAGSVSITVSGFGITSLNLAWVSTDDFYWVDPLDLDQVVQENILGSDNSSNIIGGPASTLYSRFTSGIYTDGDIAVYENLTNPDEYVSSLIFDATTYGYIHTGFAAFVPISDPAYNLPAVRVTPYTDDTYTTPVANTSKFSLYNTNSSNGEVGVFLTTTGANADPLCLNTQTLTGANNVTFDIIADSTTAGSGLFPNQVIIDATDLNIGAVTVGNYLVHNEGAITGHSRLTRINEVQGGQTFSTNAAIPLGVTAVLVTCQSSISVDTVGILPNPIVKKVELYYPIDEWIDYLNIFTFEGFNLDPTKHVPNGTNERQNDILNGTLGGTNLSKALTDREVINFRYIVDTFGNGIESGSKSIYTQLCQNRKNAFAIINAPSAKDFKDNNNPKFRDLTGALSTRFISTGGDLSLNPTIRYSLPSMTEGASWGAFYFPYISVRDLGRNINVPPAAYVSNNFIAKYENALPWSLVAGVRRGVVGGTGVVGLEINLDKEDRGYLEPFGINPIVFQAGTGPTIFANKTAQQSPKSALSSINVREVVIYIQDGIEAILKNYLFEFNTAQTRLEIKTLADNFLTTVQDDDGIYYFRNIMDESNNPSVIIDQNIGILDSYIEPVRGMEILVQRTTILKTGAISTGNFQ